MNNKKIKNKEKKTQKNKIRHNEQFCEKWSQTKQDFSFMWC